jgi:hypothetical protein
MTNPAGGPTKPGGMPTTPDPAAWNWGGEGGKETDRAPVGGIVAFAGPVASIPGNWMVCDGRALKKGDAKELFDAIGTSWGGDGAPYFFIPDLVGLFLRGVDRRADGQAIDPPRDPDRDDRVGFLPPKLPKNAGNSGNSVGSVQMDGFAEHGHDVVPFTVGWSVNGNGAGRQIDSDDGPSWSNTSDSMRAREVGGKETRAKNAAVYWIIRVR